MVQTAGTNDGTESDTGGGGQSPTASSSNPEPIRRRIGMGVSRFTDRYPFIGPSVWILAVVFFIAQVAVAYNWRSRAATPRGIIPDHPYSFFANTISDLGETAKFTYGSPAMWSPDHIWMNIAFILLGAVMIIGSPLIYQEFNEGDPHKVWIARFAFTAQFLGGAGAIFVGLNPENEHPLMHVVGAGLAIAVGTLGVFLLGLSLPLPGPIRGFMIYIMPVSLVAILLYALHEYLGFGPGGMERLAAYPEVIWLISFGIYISHSHYSNGSAHRTMQATRFGRRFAVNGEPKPFRLRLPAVRRLPMGKVNTRYRFPVTPLDGSGQAVTFTPIKQIAPGLALEGTGLIEGTPTVPGRYRLLVEVRGGNAKPVRKTYALRVER